MPSNKTQAWVAVGLMALLILILTPLARADCDPNKIEAYFHASAARDVEKAWVQISPKQEFFFGKAVFKAKMREYYLNLDEVGGEHVNQRIVDFFLRESDVKCLFDISVMSEWETSKELMKDHTKFFVKMDSQGILSFMQTWRAEPETIIKNQIKE